MSSSPFADPRLPTLADVMVQLKQDSRLPARQRDDLCSAVRTVSRVLGRPPGELIAHPKTLSEQLGKVSPAYFGLSAPSWANIRSRLRKALEHTGTTVMPGRYLAPLAPAWARLMQQLPSRMLRIGLSRFMRYCSVQGLPPEAVDPAIFAAYRTALEHEGLLNDPRTVHRETCRCWNKAVGSIDGWPQLIVEVPCYRNGYALPWSAFPKTFKADIDSMVEVAIGADLLAVTTRRPIRRISADHRVSALRQLASGAVHQGVDPDSLRSLRDLVELAVVKKGLAFMLARNGERRTTGVHGVVKAVITVARHHVRLSESELQPLIALMRHLNPKTPGMTQTNRQLLRQFEDAGRVDALLDLPGRVFAQLGRKRELKISDCIRAQAALAVRLLSRAPVRIGNLASIDLDRNIVHLRSGRHERLHLHFAAAEVKNEVELEFPLDADTQALLQLYLERYRPRLLRQPGRWLFPGETGHKGPGLLSLQITQLVEAELGVRLRAHQFRHLAGFLYLQCHPGGHEVVRRLLGHKSIETTLTFYAGMEVRTAIEHYDRTLTRLCEAARQRRRPASRRQAA